MTDPQHEEVSVADDEHADLLVALDKDLAQRRHAARPRLSGRWG